MKFNIRSKFTEIYHCFPNKVHFHIVQTIYKTEIILKFLLQKLFINNQYTS